MAVCPTGAQDAHGRVAACSICRMCGSFGQDDCHFLDGWIMLGSCKVCWKIHGRQAREATTGETAVSANEEACPDGLNERQCERLKEFVRRGQMVSPEALLRAAHAHLDDALAARHEEEGVNMNLAVCIVQVFDRVVTEWMSFTPAQQSWLRGAMVYFSKSEDDQPDFCVQGFADDVEVLNACLRQAGRSDLVLTT